MNEKLSLIEIQKEYGLQLLKLKTLYKTKYDKDLDDELLILLLKMNELEACIETKQQEQHSAISEQIDALNKKNNALSIIVFIILLMNIALITMFIFK